MSGRRTEHFKTHEFTSMNKDHSRSLDKPFQNETPGVFVSQKIVNHKVGLLLVGASGKASYLNPRMEALTSRAQ